MVRPKGFEPPTFRIGICYSIQLSYGRVSGNGNTVPLIIAQLRLYVYCNLYIALNIIDNIRVDNIVRCKAFQRRIVNAYKRRVGISGHECDNKRKAVSFIHRNSGDIRRNCISRSVSGQRYSEFLRFRLGLAGTAGGRWSRRRT